MSSSVGKANEIQNEYHELCEHFDISTRYKTHVQCNGDEVSVIDFDHYRQLKEKAGWV